MLSELPATKAWWSQLWNAPWTCRQCDVLWVGDEASTCWLCGSAGVLVARPAPNGGQQIVRWAELPADDDGDELRGPGTAAAVPGPSFPV